MESCDHNECDRAADVLIKTVKSNRGEITTTVFWDAPPQRPQGFRVVGDAYCAPHAAHLLVELTKVLG